MGPAAVSSLLLLLALVALLVPHAAGAGLPPRMLSRLRALDQHHGLGRILYGDAASTSPPAAAANNETAVTTAGVGPDEAQGAYDASGWDGMSTLPGENEVQMTRIEACTDEKGVYWPHLRIYTNNAASTAAAAQNGTGALLPVLVFIHGGGWLIGGLDTLDRMMRVLSVLLGDYVVVNVEYRLSSVVKFPGGLSDCLRALQWLGAHAPEHGGDPSRIAIAGESAGGNLAIAAAMLANQPATPPGVSWDTATLVIAAADAVGGLAAADVVAPGVQLCANMLFYPVTDYSMSSPSYADFRRARSLSFNKASMEYYWGMYLEYPEVQGHMSLASPLWARTDELAGLAPTLMLTAEVDPLRDEGEAFAVKLQEAGVPTEAHRCNGTIHAFLSTGAMNGDFTSVWWSRIVQFTQDHCGGSSAGVSSNITATQAPLLAVTSAAPHAASMSGVSVQTFVMAVVVTAGLLL